MPGGVDMHCHIAGPKVNTARKMMPDDKRTAAPMRRTVAHRSGTTGAVPSTFATGYLYAGLGYTTAFDAAIPPLAARHAHEELQDTPHHRQGLLRPDGKQPLRDAVDSGRRAGAAEGVRRLAAQRRQRLRCQARQSGRRRDLEIDRRQRDGNRRRRPAFQRHAAANHSRRRPGGAANSVCRTRCTFTATTSACRATGRRRSRR